MRFFHIDDCEADRELTRALISRTAHWEYDSASSIRLGLIQWRKRPSQVVLIDISFEGRPEQETYEAIKEISHESIVIALSGSNTQDSVSRCRDAGCSAFLNKNALTEPQAFHDAIMAGIDANLRKATAGELAPLIGMLNQLAKAVLYGNGEPGLLARTAIVETKVDGVRENLDEMKSAQLDMQSSQDAKFLEIREAQRSDRWETRLRGIAIILFLIGNTALAVVQVFHNQPIKPISFHPPEMEPEK